jgi:type I restriction enzyme S subunit
MGVRPGYKQTDVGSIPEDWEVKSLHQVSARIMVGIASTATHAYRDKGVVMFRNQNIKPGYLDDSDLLYIAEDYEQAFKNKRLKGGDLLTARTGYPGTTSIVPSQYEGAQSFTTLITRPNPELVHPAYLCTFMNSEAGQTYFEQNQIGGGQKNVNAGSLKQFPVALPPTINEQRAIAAVLSDADALIESQEQLLGKKRQIKQGAMQELLTGKKRLPSVLSQK